MTELENKFLGFRLDGTVANAIKKFVSDALYANASAYRLRKYVSILHGIIPHKNEHFS